MPTHTLTTMNYISNLILHTTITYCTNTPSVTRLWQEKQVMLMGMKKCKFFPSINLILNGTVLVYVLSWSLHANYTTKVSQCNTKNHVIVLAQFQWTSTYFFNYDIFCLFFCALLMTGGTNSWNSLAVHTGFYHHQNYACKQKWMGKGTKMIL